ncbi:MAG: 3-deoxy-7-phosphoheptulonate synthase [Thermomicrobiales bacterium]|jgi:3-deoxy-7-phosphoheptulonate synthase|nr:3-deoxy-7-phosphoheptulonate synthase [Thermomicrobiales bacterium]
MIITFESGADVTSIDRLRAEADRLGIGNRMLRFADGSVVAGFDKALPPDALTGFATSQVLPTHRPFMLTSSEHRDRSVVRVGDVAFGADTPVLIAGPCVVESTEQMIEAATAVKAAGAVMLRGGAFKPRTSPYSFQGHGETALQMLVAARDATGLPFVTEVLEPEQVDLVAAHADMLQIGARNMANTPLLKRAARSGKPILLKRGFSATIDEWLMAAEYVLSEGNPNLVLCERGIRGFDPALRFNLDLNAVPLAMQLSHLPVIVDPSHGTGVRSLVQPMALAGIAAGANGLIVEAQPDPDGAMCDGYQTISTDELAQINRRVQRLAVALKDEVDVATPDARELVRA